ncbi:hypothetical protein [Galbibacter mesophilus]|uniref:hypothetical protein n=1 Tax=Galbibacter mesophilus TaxID=379069 RepID=UPI00191D9886|nr:hypothetical protein [Galbibacter mesophilus]MCM5663997.1 hypothetical protein [Galbibacter mesophilus]
MKRTKNLVFYTLLLTAFFVSNKIAAQVPKEVSSIVKMNLDEGQDKLQNLGYEICHSSLFAKEQDWYNEKEKICVTIKFKKKSKEITEVSLNPETSKCEQGLEASRKVWEKYHDGPAPVSNSKIEEERKKLADQGFRVSYWVDQISPGNSSEYWVNDKTQKTMLIVWKVEGNEWLMTNKTEYKYGKNPAPSQQ